MEGGISGSGGDSIGVVATLGAGSGGVDSATRAEAGGGIGGGGVAVTGSGFGAKKYTFFGGYFGGTRVRVSRDTSGLYHVTPLDHTTFPVSSSSSL